MERVFVSHRMHLLLVAYRYNLILDDQRVSILTIVEGARIEVWPQSLSEALSVGVDVGQAGHIIKGDPPSFIVQEYSNNLRRLFKMEWHPWICKGLVVIFFI